MRQLSRQQDVVELYTRTAAITLVQWSCMAMSSTSGHPPTSTSSVLHLPSSRLCAVRVPLCCRLTSTRPRPPSIHLASNPPTIDVCAFDEPRSHAQGTLLSLRNVALCGRCTHGRLVGWTSIRVVWQRCRLWPRKNAAHALTRTLGLSRGYLSRSMLRAEQAPCMFAQTRSGHPTSRERAGSTITW